jgi:hypothetical protein
MAPLAPAPYTKAEKPKGVPPSRPAPEDVSLPKMDFAPVGSGQDGGDGLGGSMGSLAATKPPTRKPAARKGPSSDGVTARGSGAGRQAVTMRRALSDKRLLGHAFAPGLIRGDSWIAHRALLIAAWGEELSLAERIIFTKLTDRSREPGERADEIVVIAGRRSGKSLMIAVLICFIACLCDHSGVLAPGEKGVVLCLAPTARQALIVLDYVVGVLEASPLLSKLIKLKTQDSIELSNGIVIEVRPASFRGVRGVTTVAVVVDEGAFLFDESSGSANPDSAIIDAVKPSLATTNGMLAIISSPWARRGYVYESWERNFGDRGDKLVLVARGDSRSFNPSLSKRIVDRAFAKDPIAAATEYGAQWRSDVVAFLSREAVMAYVKAGVREIPPVPWQVYIGFVDPAGVRLMP